MFGLRENNYKFNGSILQTLRVNMTGLTKFALIFWFVVFASANIAGLMLTAWGFQFLWAWYVPGVLPMLPNAISYWHSFVTVCLIFLFMPKSKK